ncbi:helix-turn-helix domain-containing protein [Pseudomonas chlororaphis]
MEERLGCKLFRRTTRSSGLTVDGEVCFAKSPIELPAIA